MKEWLELENEFLSNNRPGTDDEPTEYYLFVQRCRADGKGRVRRTHRVETLQGANRDDLDEKLLAFTQRPDVVFNDTAENRKEAL